MLAAHGAIASYDDWPRFAELVGFQLDWTNSDPSPIGSYWVHMRGTGHPIVAGVSDFQVVDELLPAVQISPGLRAQIHADSNWAGGKIPMVMTAKGGRMLGAGKTAYIAPGHDMRAFESPDLRQLWLNAVKWCLEP